MEKKHGNERRLKTERKELILDGQIHYTLIVEKIDHNLSEKAVNTAFTKWFREEGIMVVRIMRFSMREDMWMFVVENFEDVERLCKRKVDLVISKRNVKIRFDRPMILKETDIDLIPEMSPARRMTRRRVSSVPVDHFGTSGSDLKNDPSWNGVKEKRGSVEKKSSKTKSVGVESDDVSPPLEKTMPKLRARGRRSKKYRKNNSSNREKAKDNQFISSNHDEDVDSQCTNTNYDEDMDIANYDDDTDSHHTNYDSIKRKRSKELPSVSQNDKEMHNSELLNFDELNICDHIEAMDIKLKGEKIVYEVKINGEVKLTSREEVLRIDPKKTLKYLESLLFCDNLGGKSFKAPIDLLDQLEQTSKNKINTAKSELTTYLSDYQTNYSAYRATTEKTLSTIKENLNTL